tara:strand:+ start:1373 stop:1759 length:387 start_codon:yes stop_codon:yes gene_type:complete
MSVNRYNRVKKINFDSNIKFKTSVPRPTENDYKVGYIRRYFAQRANDKGSVIFEIDNLTFKKLRTNVTYQVISIRWRISGSLTPKYDSQGNEIDKGVAISNNIAIKNKSHLIPSLKLYLPNLQQFYKS